MTVPVLLLATNDLSHIERQLSEKVAKAPDFFRNSPLLIDLQTLAGRDLPLEVEELVALVRGLELVPIGIRGGTEAQNNAALAMNLPVHAPAGGSASPAGQAAGEPAEEAEEPEVEAEPRRIVENKLVTQPVRSGQRVYARGDLIVTATVSAGAEIMAEGNIHIYGTLRGRAVAGVLGDTGSRIFCMDLQSELISIAGIYQLRDDLSKEAQHKPVSISLENQTLIIKAI